MANDLNEEQVVVIHTTTTFLGATAALRRNHNSRDIDNEIRVRQFLLQPYVKWRCQSRELYQ